MSSFMRISEAASLALHTVGMLAEEPDDVIATREIASRLAVSENHLAKVHQRLSRAGIVTAVRGPAGGFRLARPAADIKLIEVVEAIDGSCRPSQCLLGRPLCRRSSCMLGGLSDAINRHVIEFLSKTSVAQLGSSLGLA